MPPGEEWNPTSIHLGPALVDVPANWEVLDGGKRGTVVLKMPLEHDSAMQQLIAATAGPRGNGQIADKSSSVQPQPGSVTLDPST